MSRAASRSWALPGMRALRTDRHPVAFGLEELADDKLVIDALKLADGRQSRLIASAIHRHYGPADFKIEEQPTMARFRCRACGADGLYDHDRQSVCPKCGSHDVQFAFLVEELPDDHPLLEAMLRLAEDGDEDETGD